VSADVLLSDVVIDRDLLEVEARALVDSIRADITDVGERIATAYLGRAWIALGYADWDSLCDAEFEGARLRVPREVRAELVQSLSAAGLSTRAAAKALGVGKSTINRDMAGVPSGTGAPSGAPERGPVIGQDGKQYAPTQPARPQTSPPVALPSVQDVAAGEEPEPGVAPPEAPASGLGGQKAGAPEPEFGPSTADLDDDLNERLSDTDLRFLINLARAINGCGALLDLSPRRVIETYEPDSDEAAALDGLLTRMDAWTGAVRAGLCPAPALRSVR
jgi:hypothetical protein